MIKAASSYGWLLALVMALGAFLIAWQAMNPVEEVHDHVAQPAAVALGIISEDPCTTIRVGDAITRFCQRDGWIVWLNSDNEFSHAWDGQSAEFVTDPNAVPGWPW